MHWKHFHISAFSAAKFSHIKKLYLVMRSKDSQTGSFSSYDTGNINASAEGVNINTAVNLIRDDEGRLKINNITCDAKIKKMRAEFSGTLG